jgi:thiol-disulfide isomerase/thioredoxin
MYRKSIVAAFLTLLLGVPAAVLGEAPRSDLTLVLFGAQWCAPCRTEVRELAALSEAARPARLQLAWIDRAPSVAPSDRWSVLPPAEARRLFETAAPSAKGLPMAMLFDGDRVCARWEGPVSILDVRRLKDSCRVHSAPVGSD